MAGMGAYRAISAPATVDLTGCQYRIVGIDGTLVANNTLALGVLLNHPKSGESMEVGFSGHLKAFCAGTVSLGALLTVTTSGSLITLATSGGGIVGKAMKAANSGSIVEFIGDFAGAAVGAGSLV